jgi:hypothetical protein
MMSSPPRVSLALVHYPVLDREGRATATAITPMTVHDLARVARTYDMDGLYVVTPLASQQALLRRIARHYSEGFGAEYNPSRKEALSLVRVVESLNDAIQDMAARLGETPLLVATGASGYHRSIGFADLRGDIRAGEKPYLLLLGTSWGLVREIMDECDRILEPIAGRAGYNHLPVREAAAIIIDRLLGPGVAGLE